MEFDAMNNQDLKHKSEHFNLGTKDMRWRSWKKWRISCPRTRWRKGWQCRRQTSWRERSCWSTSGWRLMWKKQKWSFSSRWELQNQIYEFLNNRDNNADNDGQGALEVDDAAEDPNAAAPEKKPDEPTGGRIIELIPSSVKALWEYIFPNMHFLRNGSIDKSKRTICRKWAWAFKEWKSVKILVKKSFVQGTGPQPHQPTQGARPRYIPSSPVLSTTYR